MTLVRAFRFVAYGTSLAPKENCVAVAVGNRCLPGVVDPERAHDGAHGQCVSEFILENPRLVGSWLAEAPTGEVTIVTRAEPDFDAALSCYFAWRIKLDGGPPRGAEALAKYACAVEAGEIAETGPKENSPLALFTAMAEIASREAAERGLSAEQGWTLRMGRAFELFDYLAGWGGDLAGINSGSAMAGTRLFDAEKEFVRQSYGAYLEDARRAQPVEIALPRKDGDGLAIVPGLIVRDPRCALFTAWAWQDTVPGHGRGREFTLVGYLDAPVARFVISVSPKSPACLAGLGEDLERDEEVAEQKAGRRRTGVNPAMYDNPDPWRDGRGPFNGYTLVQSPAGGTLLSWEDVVGAVWGYSLRHAALDASSRGIGVRVRGKHVPGKSASRPRSGPSIRFTEKAADAVGAELPLVSKLLGRLFFDPDKYPAVFSTHVTVARGFSGGRSSAEVLEVWRFRESMGPYLSVVKYGPSGDISEEKSRFDDMSRHIEIHRQFISGIIAMEAEDRAGRGALVYVHAGDFNAGEDQGVQSFGDAAKEAVRNGGDGDGRAGEHTRMLVELIRDVFGKMRGAGFHAGAHDPCAFYGRFYNRRLPPNLVVEAEELRSAVRPVCAADELLAWSDTPGPATRVGERVCFDGLTVIKTAPGAARCVGGTSDGVFVLRSSGDPGNSLEGLKAGKRILNVLGRIEDSRCLMLARSISGACAEAGINLETLLTSGKERFPDPLSKLHDFLAESPRYYPMSFSHGDLNTENILLIRDRAEKGGAIRSWSLIDWACSGRALPLAFDFVKIETELRTRVLAELLPDLAAEEGWKGAEQAIVELFLGGKLGDAESRFGACETPAERMAWLICAVRAQAFGCVAEKDHPKFRADYLKSLFFYALGTHKFDITARAKRMSYFLAAVSAAALAGRRSPA